MGINTAIVVDVLAEMGGAERVLLQALKLFPSAPVYTMIYAPEIFRGTALGDHPIHTSLIQNLPFSRSQYRKYLPLMPLAIQQFDLSAYDLILSFSYAVAHGVRTRAGQRHLSYTYTPMRYAWRNYPYGQGLLSCRWVVQALLGLFRKWDRAKASQVTRFAAVSQDIASWIQAVYHREARVIYPPVELERFGAQAEREDRYITVSRLVPHKHIDLIVRAFSQLELPLTIVGDGPEFASLKKIAAPNILFTGYLPDPVVACLLSKAAGFVCAAEEDFGISIIEAQASSCPVIAYAKGGALETVIDQKTGLFFQDLTVESLIDTVERFQKVRRNFYAQDLVNNARRFGEKRFLDEFSAFVHDSI